VAAGRKSSRSFCRPSPQLSRARDFAFNLGNFGALWKNSLYRYRSLIRGSAKTLVPLKHRRLSTTLRAANLIRDDGVGFLLRDAKALSLPAAFGWSSFDATVFGDLIVDRGPKRRLHGQERWSKKEEVNHRRFCAPDSSPRVNLQDELATKVSPLQRIVMPPESPLLIDRLKDANIT
jgi:hypothetical protein